MDRTSINAVEDMLDGAGPGSWCPAVSSRTPRAAAAAEVALMEAVGSRPAPTRPSAPAIPARGRGVHRGAPVGIPRAGEGRPFRRTSACRSRSYCDDRGPGGGRTQRHPVATVAHAGTATPPAGRLRRHDAPGAGAHGVRPDHNLATNSAGRSPASTESGGSSGLAARLPRAGPAGAEQACQGRIGPGGHPQPGRAILSVLRFNGSLPQGRGPGSSSVCGRQARSARSVRVAMRAGEPPWVTCWRLLSRWAGALPCRRAPRRRAGRPRRRPGGRTGASPRPPDAAARPPAGRPARPFGRCCSPTNPRE